MKQMLTEQLDHGKMLKVCEESHKGEHDEYVSHYYRFLL